MKNFMNSVKIPPTARNGFDLSHDVKLSLKFGYLYPTLAMECLPGDKFKIGCETLCRFMPMVNPVMHKFNVTTHYYFVPNRLLWTNWEKFITHRDDGTQPSHPYGLVGGDITPGNPFYPPLADYMGIPKPPNPSPNAEEVDLLPFMAYQLIWKEFYRDQNNIDMTQPVNSVPESLVDGDNTGQAFYPALFQLRKRAWEHDYFTSCLPTPQAGVPIEIPMDGVVPVERNSTFEDDVYSWTTTIPGPTNFQTRVTGGITDDPNVPFEHLYTNLENAAGTIEDLRRASAIQRFMEKLIRGGKRYAEVIRSFFGTRPQDARLQRPEYITGVKTPVMISEVLNTTGTEELPQGNMAGHGIAAIAGGYSEGYECQEHGFIIGIMSVMPSTAYQNGLPRSFFRKTYFSYFWPEFSNLGEEAIQSRELYAYQGNAGTETFGYLPMYSRYRTMPNRVAGQFRTTLDTWHFGRIFTAPPELNQEFIECTPGKRIFAVTDEDEDELVAHCYHKIFATRPVPKFGTPTLF